MDGCGLLWNLGVDGLCTVVQGVVVKEYKCYYESMSFLSTVEKEIQLSKLAGAKLFPQTMKYAGQHSESLPSGHCGARILR